jgi:HEPN domain-containing protein
MRNKPLDEGQRWLRQAREDLHWAQHLAAQGAYHLACFLAQQVTGKALKAFLYAQGEEIVLGHSVERLCASAATFETEFQKHARSWSILDGYYIPTR